MADGERMKIVVLDGYALNPGDLSWDELGRCGRVEVHDRTREDQVLERAAGAGMLLTNKTPLSAATLRALPDLRYIGILATGTNVVDLAAARAAGVAVTNVPSYAAASIAQHVAALILHFTQDVAGHSAAVKAGAWAASPDFAFFTKEISELDGKTLVLVGSGAIGGAVARIAGAFGMRVVRAAVPGSPTRAGRAPLADALPGADFVSLHCPLTDATRGMVDARFLAALKPGAILINTARGPIVDEDALYDALTKGTIAGAGLDVHTIEPRPTPDRLATLPNVILTPHIAGGSRKGVMLEIEAILNNCRAVLASQPVRYQVTA